MYTPDRVFMERLKDYDPNLDCRYDNFRENFEIFAKDKYGKEYHVMWIEQDDGGFRQPDNRDLNRIREIDWHRTGKTVKEHMKEVIDYMDQYRYNYYKDNKNFMDGAVKDNRIQIRNAFVKAMNLRKGNSTFRRIEVKPKGETFK